VTELIDYSETVPIQYQRGYEVFLGRKFLVDQRVFIPRPETELLVKEVLERLDRSLPLKCDVLDLCTGSGAVAVSLACELQHSRVMATDISSGALEVAATNVEKHAAGRRVSLYRSDIYRHLDTSFEGSFDVIVSNPPYVSERDYQMVDAWVRAEPRSALLSGPEGMDHILRIVRGADRYLLPGGILALETGYDQANKVASLLDKTGYGSVKIIDDHNGIGRVVSGVING
jgi:release factor glutamine methyltransferase